ncbi:MULTISPECIES: hypothetical protein [unclassified Campylobacter]|uniref:hypothetical protein n=1 Tax=unclassified Campylobacter TaxID=2593542 RepID=UPI001BDA2FC6|nr:MULTISPECIES: hypothetical protein [unclassified Campylobacter]MBZ7991565.1 hypothetical protein [Campylobacter sp. RM9331]MBZ8005961.1 hypothetical protein [Campylobacter sp. RM9332]MBT0881501.1 hypothetical protein [Campylobacter sp. 2018MI27]MBT0885473.1 hypothetical protein [Campylobacter sp. 2018MI10]ULO04083.1 hypothetical protein AVBRAN_1639 [Campylobacter sp. RM12651]
MRISGFDVDISKVFDTSYHKANLSNFHNLNQEQINAIKDDITNQNYALKTSDKDNINVVFSFDNNTQGVNLSKNTIEKLMAHFDKADFILSDDKLILNGNAANFVSSWFKTIAYDLGLAKADSNQDGRINNDELSNARLEVGVYGEFNGYIYVVNKLSDERFINTKTYDKLTLEIGTSISEYLDSVISSDRDFDGVLSFAEINFENISEEQDYKSELKEKNTDIKRYQNEFQRSIAYFAKEGQSTEEIKNKQKEKELEQAELLAKLMQITQKIKQQGLNSLTSDDNKILEKLGKSANAIANSVEIDLSISVVEDLVNNKILDIKV